MATLHLMVGLPCSGKTTAARALATQYSALRLTTDEWHISLFGDDFSEADDPDHSRHNARHSKLEALLWELATQSLARGTSVILDFGFWTKAERDEFRRRARDLGVDFRIHFADAPEAVLLERLAARNAERPPGTFHIREAEMRQWFDIFERPTRDELET